MADTPDDDHLDAAGEGLAQLRSDAFQGMIGDPRTGDHELGRGVIDELSAHRRMLIAADNKLGIDLHNITWKRVLDVNDRALRNIVVGLGAKADGVPRQTGFDITAASEAIRLPSVVAPRASADGSVATDPNAADADVSGYLRFFTLLDRAATEALEAEQAARPEARPAQRYLAFDLTARLHGEDAARHAVRVSEAAFSREPIRDPAVLATLYEAVGRFEFGDEDLADGAGRFLVATRIFASNGEARRAIAGGGAPIRRARPPHPPDPPPPPAGRAWPLPPLGRRPLRLAPPPRRCQSSPTPATRPAPTAPPPRFAPLFARLVRPPFIHVGQPYQLGEYVPGVCVLILHRYGRVGRTEDIVVCLTSGVPTGQLFLALRQQADTQGDHIAPVSSRK